MNNKIPNSVCQRFDLSGRVAVVTGGAGLLGIQHAEALAEMGAIPVLVDVDGAAARARAATLSAAFQCEALGIEADITKPESVGAALAQIMSALGRVDILINNAARNPKMEGGGADTLATARFESYPLEVWNLDLAVGLTGAFLCSQIFGAEMAKRKQGVILNIASDLAVIAPDQRLYRRDGVPEDQQPVKPVSYSVIKHGLVGLTRYLATYWCESGVRVNALSPGGVYAGQDETFVKRLSHLIPLGRMARQDEYKAAVVFMVSDASSYMTGANVIIDGGRTTW